MKADYKNVIKNISEFDLNNAIEADIVREYIAGIPQENLNAVKELKKADIILKSGARYPMVKLGDFLLENTNKIKPSNNPYVKWRILRVSNEIGIFKNEDAKPEETNQTYILVNKNEFCYNPYRINVGSIGLNEFDYENQLISGAYVVFETNDKFLNPQYLNLIFRSELFAEYVNQKANVGNSVRMNITFEDMCNFLIPLPDIDIQN